MGFDLARGTTYDDGGDVVEFGKRGPRFNIAGWEWLIETAKKHGWTPGPLTLRGEPYDGGYYFNDGQVVSAETAIAWADALERAYPYRGETGRWRQLVADFIVFCRAGAFEIW